MTGRELSEMGKRAMACKGWAWMPGMVTLSGIRVYAVNAKSTCDGMDNNSEYLDADPVKEGWIPDLGDEVTLGCLLQLVRAAWRDGRMHHACADEWCVLIGVDSTMWARARTKVGVMVLALEAAP